MSNAVTSLFHLFYNEKPCCNLDKNKIKRGNTRNL